MGFGLYFMRLASQDVVHPDLHRLAAWLEYRGLHVAPSNDSTHHLAGPDGQLSFDGHWTDLHLDPLDQEEPVTGGIWHATLSRAECEFIYALCLVGRMLIVNPQGPPTYIVPERNHRRADLPSSGDDDIAWVNNADELAQALTGNFAAFLEYRNQVVGGSEET